MDTAGSGTDQVRSTQTSWNDGPVPVGAEGPCKSYWMRGVVGALGELLDAASSLANRGICGTGNGYEPFSCRECLRVSLQGRTIAHASECLTGQVLDLVRGMRAPVLRTPSLPSVIGGAAKVGKPLSCAEALRDAASEADHREDRRLTITVRPGTSVQEQSDLARMLSRRYRAVILRVDEEGRVTIPCPVHDPLPGFVDGYKIVPDPPVHAVDVRA